MLISGGANVAQQYLDAGLVDELNIALVPVLLGAGDTAVDNVAKATFGSSSPGGRSPGVTHLRYCVVR